MATIESNISEYLNSHTFEPLPTYTEIDQHRSPSSPPRASTDTSISILPSEPNSISIPIDPPTAANPTGPSFENLRTTFFNAISNRQDDVVLHLLTTYGPRENNATSNTTSHIPGIHANLRDSSGKTALATAVETGNIAIVSLLVNWGADVDAWSVQGEYKEHRRIYEREQAKKETKRRKEEKKQRKMKMKELERMKKEMSRRARNVAGNNGGDSNISSPLARSGRVEPSEEGDSGISRPLPGSGWVSGSREVHVPPEQRATIPHEPDDTPHSLHPEYQILRTPLMIAAEKGYLPILNLLLQPPCNADSTMCAPDGQVALRLASKSGHREIVNALPSIRKGGLKRFQHDHAKSMYRIRRTTEVLRFLAVVAVWEIPKTIVWRLPKWAAKRTWKALKWVISIAIPKATKATASGLVKAGKWAVNDLPVAIANGGKRSADGVKTFLGTTLPNFAVTFTKAILRFFTKHLPKFTVSLVKFLYRCCTTHVPRFLKWLVVKAIWGAIIKGTWRILQAIGRFFWRFVTEYFPEFCHLVAFRLLSLTRGIGNSLVRGTSAIVSLLHTVLVAITTFFRSITIRDILNGFVEVLRWAFVEIPTSIGLVVRRMYFACERGISRVFGLTGEVCVWIWRGVVYMIVYVPVKIGEVAVEYGRVVRRGMKEIVLWVNPKAML